MQAYKDKETSTWYCSFYYRDYNGKNRRKMKRGFPTKREAMEYEVNFIAERSGSVDIPLKNFYEIYKKDKMPRMRLNTWLTKESVIETHILPYFGYMRMDEIQARDIVRWQNMLMETEDDVGTRYSPTYLRTINTQLSAMFNHAVKFYGLKENPIHKSGSMGKKHSDEMNIWTREEFEEFLETQKDDSMAETAFLILFWCGLRIGELLALTKADFDFENNSIRISKSYQRIRGRDVITEPKTEKSNRIVFVPQMVMNRVELFVYSRHGNGSNDRVFDKTKSFYGHRFKNGIKKSGVKEIRIHDLRHSHVSLLFEMGYSPVDIANRMGHENINVTMRYAHMMPSKQESMAEDMNALIGEDDE